MATFFTALVNLSMAQPVSDFAIDAESWNTVGMCPAESSPGATWSATGGSPSGACLKATDNSIGVFYWYAGGAEWKGDLSAYYGCYLYFDLKTSNTGSPVGSKYDVLIIKSDDQTISYNSSPNPGLTWSTYIVPLNETGWILDGLLDAANCPDLVGPAATAADMMTYLSDIKKIRIRAEFGGLTSETNYLDNVEISCEPLLLPVTLDDFQAFELDHNRSVVEWKTLSEINSLGFQVEKSLDGEVFDSIGYVPAAGYSNETLKYQFIDNDFTKDAYYRLKSVKDDYRTFFSDIILLKPLATHTSQLQLFPNPANNLINLVVNAEQTLLYWEVTDLSGKQIRFENIGTDAAAYTNTIDVSNWQSGIYIIKLHTVSGILVQKFEVLK